METKICSKCNEDLPIKVFNFRNKAENLRRAECKECFNKLTQKHYKANKNKYYANVLIRRERNKIFLKEFLSDKKCKDCGFDDWRVLEFDHLRDKSRNISKMLSDNTIDSIKKEIEKCEIICANCHRLRTHIRSNSYRVQ